MEFEIVPKLIEVLGDHISSWFGIRRFRFISSKALVRVAGQANAWRSETSDPSFVVTCADGIPHGWVLFKFKVRSLDGAKLKPSFVIKARGNSTKERREFLSVSRSGRVSQLVNLPFKDCTIHFIPANKACLFSLDEGIFRPIGRLELTLRLSVSHIKVRILSGRNIMGVINNAIRLIRQQRFAEIRLILMRTHRDSKKSGSYVEWIKEIEPNLLAALPSTAKTKLETDPPIISVLMSTYNTPASFLRIAIESVLGQSYRHWELCIVDDRSIDESVRTVIKAYASRDDRIKVHFRQQNGHISTSLNTAIGMASGDFMTVLDHDDCLATRALEWIACTIIEHPKVDYIYSDEDKISADGERFDPVFKPDWSPECMLSSMYTGHMSVFRTSLVKSLGGFRSAFDGAQDYDLALRVIARTDRIIHIPHVLYHWRVWANSNAMSLDAKPYAYQKQREALTEFLRESDESFKILDHPLSVFHRVIFQPKRQSLVSIIIPTANGKIDLTPDSQRHIDALVKSIKENTSYKFYEIIIVHNGDLTQEQISRFQDDPTISLVPYSESIFSLSRKINIGVAASRGEFILLLNDDVRIITCDWLELMLGMAQRPRVGAVGARLLFPNDTIQHAGVTVLDGMPGHPFYGEPKYALGYGSALQVDKNYIAVTGACQMTPRALFIELGGYSGEFPLNYNDVEYCMRLYRRGYRMVSMANVLLYHYEGVSKEGGRGVSDKELSKFLDVWNASFDRDPYYSPNLSQTENFEPPW
jgi:glycosyltransferase involved in cell wall biosynthesis